MRNYVDFLLLRTFGIKRKQFVENAGKPKVKTVYGYIESYSFNEWIHHIYGQLNYKL